MTKKELAYVEDVLNHAKHFYWQCDEALSSVNDEALKEFINGLKQEVEQIYNNLFNTVSK